jgi:hypothetical protein
MTTYFLESGVLIKHYVPAAGNRMGAHHHHAERR